MPFFENTTWPRHGCRLPADRLRDYGTKYGQKGFPMIIFFQPDGTIARESAGYLDAAALREALRILIDGQAGKVS